MLEVEKMGDNANGCVGYGPDIVQPLMGTLSPSPDKVPVQPPPTEGAGDGSDSNGTPHWPYILVNTIPWINRRKGMNVKNLTRDPFHMGYRPFEVGLHGNSLCIFIVFQVVFDTTCSLDRKTFHI